MSRCTDELGTVQPTRAEVAKYWNKPLDENSVSRGNDNSVQPWKITERRECSQWPCLDFSSLRRSWNLRDRLDTVAQLWRRQGAERGGNPRLGYCHQPERKRTPGRAGDGQRRRGDLCAESARAATGQTESSEGHAPTLIRGKVLKRPMLPLPCLSPCVNDANTMSVHSPYATVIWDYINRGMPLGKEGSLTPNEVYSLTAFLLYRNDVIKEDDVMDTQSLPKVKMPNHDGFALPEPWKHGEPRLQGYP